jgi:hypothetical protein
VGDRSTRKRGENEWGKYCYDIRQGLHFSGLINHQSNKQTFLFSFDDDDGEKAFFRNWIDIAQTSAIQTRFTESERGVKCIFFIYSSSAD